jgi:hypothetical protein
VLWKKDHSACLDNDLAGVAFTYRTWLLVDAIIAISLFGLMIILII